MGTENSKYCGCLYFSANSLARCMTRIAEEEFALTGLSPSHALILRSVMESPGIQPKELSTIMELSPSTVTRLIEKLESRGLVTRTIAGRNTEIHPTEAAKPMDRMIKAAWSRLKSRYTEALGEEKSRTLTEEVYGACKLLE